MFDIFYFQALAVKESRVREATRQRKTMRGRESRGRTVFFVVINRENKRLRG